MGLNLSDGYNVNEHACYSTSGGPHEHLHFYERVFGQLPHFRERVCTCEALHASDALLDELFALVSRDGGGHGVGVSPHEEVEQAVEVAAEVRLEVGVPQNNPALPKQLVVRACSLKDRQSFAFSPDDQPVADIGHVTLPAAGPASMGSCVLCLRRSSSSASGVFWRTRLIGCFMGARSTCFAFSRLASFLLRL